MAEHSTSPPLTIASLRAMREKKRQLAAQPPPIPFELTHRVFDDHSPTKQEDEQLVAPSRHTRHGLAGDTFIKDGDIQPANPHEHRHAMLEGSSVMMKEGYSISTEKDRGDTEHRTSHGPAASSSDEPDIEHIRTTIAALSHITEPTGLNHSQAYKFRWRKKNGLALLLEVLAEGLPEPKTPTTASMRGDTASAVKSHDTKGAVVIEELPRSSGTATPSENARAMLLHPHAITMADVQALGLQIKHMQKAQKKGLKLLETEEGRPADSKMDKWLEGGVQNHLQVMKDQAHQFESGNHTHKRKPTHNAPEPALRGVVLGKRSATTPLQPYGRSFTGAFSSLPGSELANVIAQNADPTLVAMRQVIPDLRKDALQEIATNILVPTVVEYLDDVKRRRLGTLATAHDTSTDYRPQQSQPVLVAQTLAKHSASSLSPSNFRIEGFLMGIRNGTMTEEKVPSNFSIKTQMDNGDIAIHASVSTDAYTTIFKALSVLNLLDRDMNKVEDSKANGIKGRWTCLFKKALNEMCKWPAEGEAGQYACDWCMRRRRPCVIVIKGVFSVVPLAPSLRMGRGLGDREYCVLPQGAVCVKPKFFS